MVFAAHRAAKTLVVSATLTDLHESFEHDLDVCIFAQLAAFCQRINVSKIICSLFPSFRDTRTWLYLWFVGDDVFVKDTWPHQLVW